MTRLSNRRIAYPLVLLALVGALLVAENLPGNDAEAAPMAGAGLAAAEATHAQDLADLPLMYE